MKHSKLSLVILGLSMVLMARPASAAPGDSDLSTPQATAKSLYYAVEAKDAAAIHRIFYIPADDEQHDARQARLVDGFVDLILSGRKLGDAAKEKFGDGAQPFLPGMIGKNDLVNYDKGDIVEGKDPQSGLPTAALTPAGSARPLHFTKVGNEWKLDVTDFEGIAGTDLARQLHTLKSMAEVMDQTAADITAGKYATPQDAEAAMKQKFYAVMIDAVQHNPPATAPTTQPAK